MSTAAQTAKAPPSAVGHRGSGRKTWQAVGLALSAVGLLQLTLALARVPLGRGWAALLLFLLPLSLGSTLYSVATYHGTTPGIKNDGTVTGLLGRRSVVAWILAAVLTSFYIFMYWYPKGIAGASALSDPASRLLRGAPADQYFLYSFLYTVAVLLFGLRFIYRYRHNRYQILRTLSVMFFQLGLAFLVPNFLRLLGQKEHYFSYFWPLSYNNLFPQSITGLWNDGHAFTVFIVFWSFVASLVLVPVLTYFVGKRWYCSWVCGCGGLAETAGDSFRHLSSKSLGAWRFERWSIHLVLVFVVVTTALLWLNMLLGGWILGKASFHFAKVYGFGVGLVLAGVVGVGFYPILGNRVWCRFFCPQAAILGIFQRFLSRFRITTNGGQCMSCGNCSKYCEMGIDVRSYAQRGDNIVRASCVGCGVCAAVCPRGVLKLENGETHTDRFDGAARPLAEVIKSLKS